MSVYAQLPPLRVVDPQFDDQEREPSTRRYLKEIHDEINALGGKPKNEIEAAEEKIIGQCLAIIEKYLK